MEKPIFGAIALIAHAGLSLFAGETLENECMRIHFAGADEGFAVTAIVNKVAGNVRFVTRETKPLRGPLSDLWKLEMSGSNETFWEGEQNICCYTPPENAGKPMCPAVPFWRDAIFDFVSRAVTEVGANMVYLDMMGISKAQPCFAAGHPHPAGGGTWWHDGYTDVISALRAKHPGIPFTTEGCCERWIHIVDGFLVAVPLPDDVKPFYTAVYSDYATYFGTPLNRNADISGFKLSNLNFCQEKTESWSLSRCHLWCMKTA